MVAPIQFDNYLHDVGEAPPFENHAVVQALAWQVGSELVRRHPDELRLIETHPGGGQYDCVTVIQLVGRGPNFGARKVLDMNTQPSAHLTPTSWHQRGGERFNWLEVALCDDIRRYVISRIERLEGLRVRRSTPPPTATSIGLHLISVFMKRAVLSSMPWHADNAYCDADDGSSLRSDLLGLFPQVDEELATTSYQGIDGNPYYRFWFVRPELPDAEPQPEFVVDTWTGTFWTHGGPGIRLMQRYKQCGSSIDRLVSDLCPQVLAPVMTADPTKPTARDLAIPTEVGRTLKKYVYLLTDPLDDDRPFYVGKGTGGRAVSHLRRGNFLVEVDSSVTRSRIRQIKRSGNEPGVIVVRHGLDDKEAFLVESALISTLPGLTNAVGGHDPLRTGRATLDEVITRYGAKELATEVPPAVLIRLGVWTDESELIEGTTFRTGRGWRPAMPDSELYDSVRCWWHVNPSSLGKRGVLHAVAVHEGVTRMVVEIDSTSWRQRDDGRRAFTGTIIKSGKVHAAYIGRVGKQVPFVSNAQNPITYWPRKPGP